MNSTAEKQNGFESGVLRMDDTDMLTVRNLLRGYGLNLILVANVTEIPGSFWGESEAGLIENRLYARADTPVHSLLHEACHYICMHPERRKHLDTNAGGDYDEENAVCYLQILLAEAVPGLNRGRMMRDMDAWGYSFRLGAARNWFERDADESRQWLQIYGIIDADEQPTGKLRMN